MKLFDEIKVLNTCNSYTENGIYKGRIGRINAKNRKCRIKK